MVINCDVHVMMLFYHLFTVVSLHLLFHLRPGSGRQRKRTPGAGVKARRAQQKGWQEQDAGYGGYGGGGSTSSSWRLWMSKLFQT